MSHSENAFQNGQTLKTTNDQSKRLNSIPKKVLTFDEVKKELGDDCPKAVVNAILKLENPKEVIPRVKQALDDIAEAAGQDARLAFYVLENDKIAELFVKNSDLVVKSFVEIAKAAGQNAEWAFYALRNDKIAELFVKNPNAFVEIAKAAGQNAERAFYVLENTDVAKLFLEKPDLVVNSFVKIAKAAGQNAGPAFTALAKDKIAALFAQNPDLVVNSFIKIAKATGKGAFSAFWTLTNDKIAALFAQNPDLIVNSFGDIVKATGDYATGAFDALGNDKIAELFVKYTNAFVEFAKAAGQGARPAFDALRNDKIAELFTKNPDLFVNSFGKIVEVTGKYAARAFSALNNDKIAELFTKNPDLVVNSFVEIAKATGKDASAFSLIDDIAELFVNNPNAFVEIAKASGKYTPAAFESLRNDKIAKLFSSYTRGEITFDKLMLHIYSSQSFAIELGRPLDDLGVQHRDNEREKYLNSLSKLQVLGLLLSNPAFFYTSTNHMLLDRLKKDFGTKGLLKVFEKYELFGTEELRNFLFRIINYGRFYGTPNSVFDMNLVEKTLNTLIDPLEKPTDPLEQSTFNPGYYFLLANSLEKIKDIPKIRKKISTIVQSKLDSYAQNPPTTEDEQRIVSALEFIAVQLDIKTTLVSENKKNDIADLNKKRYFNRKNYTDKKGRLVVVQVFDKKDTEKDHWILSQKWFRKYGEPKKGEKGELIYETKDAVIIMFCGEPEKNQEFIKYQLEKTPNCIMTFRGHSFSLMRSFPPDIFGNKESNILFIPGSCGSAGSTPYYILANPNTNLVFISNTSTGRGQVTNALIDALLDSSSDGESFEDILKDNRESIEKNGGDIATIRAWTPGEVLLYYVFKKKY